MRLKRKRFDFYIILVILLTLVCNTSAKWGSSKSSKSPSSSPSRSSPSTSRPYPSQSYYSNPSPSSLSYSSYHTPAQNTYRPPPQNTYRPPPQNTYRPAPAYPATGTGYPLYPAPVPQHPAPPYGFNTNAARPSFTPYTPSFGTSVEKPITSNAGWNVNSGNTGSNPSKIGWNVTPRQSVPAAPPASFPTSFPAPQNRPVTNYNTAPVYSNVPAQPPYGQNYHAQPPYGQNYAQPVHGQNVPTQRPYGQNYYAQTTIRYSPNYNPGYRGSGYNPSQNHGYQSNQHHHNYPSNNYGYGSNAPRQNTYNQGYNQPNNYYRNQGYNQPNNNYGNQGYNQPNNYYGNQGYNQPNNYYGNTFGSQGLPQNSYLYGNNYYGKKKKSGFLTKALFFGGGMGGGYALGRYASRHNKKDNDFKQRDWNEDEDMKWRATTRAPYFENKVPGGDKILPASAAIGAATAFGLVSLLPLNVPLGKPLMYCNDTELMQSPIQINGNIYICYDSTVEIWCPPNVESATTGNQNVTNVTEQPHCVNITKDVSCPKVYENGTEVIDQSQCVNQTIKEVSESCTNPIIQPKCVNRTMQCNKNVGNEYNSEVAYCLDGVLYSSIPLSCNESLPLNGFIENQTIALLNCYEGLLPESQVAFIPTTFPPPTTTTERPLSFGAKAHIFFLRIIGKGDIIEKTTTIAPEIPPDSWYPEALTYPPDLNETVIEPPFIWMQPVQVKLENGTIVTNLEPVPLDVIEQQEKDNQMSNNGTSVTVNPRWVKIYITNSMEMTTPLIPINLNETTIVSETSTKSEQSNT